MVCEGKFQRTNDQNLKLYFIVNSFCFSTGKRDTRILLKRSHVRVPVVLFPFHTTTYRYWSEVKKGKTCRPFPTFGNLPLIRHPTGSRMSICPLRCSTISRRVELESWSRGKVETRSLRSEIWSFSSCDYYLASAINSGRKWTRDRGLPSNGSVVWYWYQPRSKGLSVRSE